MIYLDNAATSLHKPKTVADAVYQTLVSGSVGNAARGSNEASLQALRLAVEPPGRTVWLSASEPGGIFHECHRQPEYGN